MELTDEEITELVQQHKQFLRENIELLKDPFEIKEGDKVTINHEKLPEAVINKALKKLNKIIEEKFEEYVEADFDDTISKFEQAEKHNPIRPTIDTSKYIHKSTIESFQPFNPSLFPETWPHKEKTKGFETKRQKYSSTRANVAQMQEEYERTSKTLSEYEEFYKRIKNIDCSRVELSLKTANSQLANELVETNKLISKLKSLSEDKSELIAKHLKRKEREAETPQNALDIVKEVLKQQNIKKR